MNLRNAAALAAGDLEQVARQAVDALADHHNADNGDVMALVLHEFWQRMKPRRDGGTDARNKAYRIHIAIFDACQQLEPRADSRGGEPEGMVVTGLPGVGKEIVDSCRLWHAEQGHLDDGGQLIGLGNADIERSLRGLRPTISRHRKAERARAAAAGEAPGLFDVDLRIKYQTFDNVGGKGGWIVRCNITPLDKED